MNEPKWFHIEPFSWFQRTPQASVLIIEPLKMVIEPFRGSKYVALIEPFLLRV